MKLRKGLAVCAAIMGITGPVGAETLANALTNAYNHSGVLEQNRALLRAADEDVAQAVARTLPVIEWTASATNSNLRPEGSDLLALSATLSASLTLYDGGVNKLAIEAQKETVLGTRQSLRAREQEVLLRAVEAYMEMRRNTEFVALRNNNVRVITQEFRAAQDRFEVGEVTRTDVSLAEARLASARSLLASAQGNLALSVAEFRNATGQAPVNPNPVDPAPVSRTLADAKAFAVRNHPSIRETQHSVTAAELNIQRAEAAYNPTLTLNGRLNADRDFQVLTQEYDINQSRSIGLNARGTIYSGGSLSSLVRQAMARRDATRASLHITRHNVEQQVANSFAQYEVARASRQASMQQIAAATVAFRGVREEATLGARTTLDVLNAEQELLDAQANAISAQADEVIASYRVLASMGLLTAEHLRLPVQIYDPSAYYNLVKDSPAIVSEQGQALDRVLRAIGQ